MLPPSPPALAPARARSEELVEVGEAPPPRTQHKGHLQRARALAEHGALQPGGVRRRVGLAREHGLHRGPRARGTCPREVTEPHLSGRK